MAKPEQTGQDKLHKVLDANGNETQMTQAEWKARDKSAGLTRVDEEPTPESEAPVPTPTQEPPPA